MVSDDPSTIPPPKPPKTTFNGTYDTKQVNLYYVPVTSAGTIHVRHMVRTSSSGSFSQASTSDISVKKLPDTRTVTPTTTYGTVLGSSLSYSGGFSSTLGSSRTITTSLTTSKKEAWVTFFYEKLEEQSVTGDFDIMPGEKLANGTTFKLHPKDFDLKACTYISHRYKIEKGDPSNNHVEPNVYGMNTDSEYDKDHYPPLIADDSSYTIYLKIFSSCGETDWIAPHSLEFTGSMSPHGPAAIITGPSRIKAGQPLPFPLDGSQSFDWDDKDIVRYTWDHKETGTDMTTYEPDYLDTPGTYSISLTVQNSAGAWSADATHDIEVVPNDPPVALLTVPPEQTRLGTSVIRSKAFSTDGDRIVSHKFQVKYDAINNGFADDAWTTVQEGASDSYSFKPNRIGKYLFREEACEVGNVCGNNDDQIESERTLVIENLAPSADVKTSSPVTEPDNRTPLLMSSLYNTGTIVSLTNGATGDKSGWILQDGELRTKAYKTDLGMFNENWGAADNYYGEDTTNHTVFASIQNTPSLSLISGIDTTFSKIFTDEKYVYVLSMPARQGSSSMTVKIYNKSIVLQRTVTLHSSYGFTYDGLGAMVKGNLLYVTDPGNFGTMTHIVNRETGSILKPDMLAGMGAYHVSANDYYRYSGSNNLYADGKGVIGIGVAKNYYTQTANEVYAGYFRANYDFSSPEAYFQSQRVRYIGIPQYISQHGNSVYTDDLTDPMSIIYDANQVQVGYLKSPAGQTYNFDLLGVDGNHNFYSIGRQGSYGSEPQVFIHDSTGNIIRYFDYPSELYQTNTYKRYSGGSSWDVPYYSQKYNSEYTVDSKGNIWTTYGEDGGTEAYAVAITPTGEYKKVAQLPKSVPNSNESWQKTLKILVGSDGLVTYFYYATDTSDNTAPVYLQIVVIDPETYTVVKNVKTQNIYSSGTTESIRVSGVEDENNGTHYTMPFNVLPLGDQSYLIFAYSQLYPFKGNLYLLSASGNLSYPKAYDIGTPSSDMWLGSTVAEGLVFQGDLTPATTSTAAAGYVYLAQDKDNYYSAEFENGQLKVKKTVSGSTSTIFSKAYTTVADQTYTLRFVPENGGFSLYVNKLKQTTITETTWKNGKYGLISRGKPGAVFANALTDQEGKKLGSISGVVLVGETLTYDVKMDDPENDPRVTDVETWTYTHNPNVFLQPQGTWSESGKQVKSPVTTFDLPGEYSFKFRTKDDPNPDYLYPSNVFDEYRKDSNEVTGVIRVHRRPVAVPGVTVNSSQQLTYTDNSYDPDRFDPATGTYSTENTGIDYAATHGVLERHWRYRLENSSVYTDGQPKRLTAGKYVVELDVTDEYGAHSGWVAVNVDVEGYEALPPIAGFTIAPILTYRGVPVTINSTASDPQDGDRTNIEHAYYIRNVTTGGAETLQSEARTSWDKLFNSLGVFNVRQLVTNSYGLSDEASHMVTVVNRKPVAALTAPGSSHASSPTLLDTLTPEFVWTYSDPDGDSQSKFQVQVYRADGTVLLDSGARSGSQGAWTPSADLPEETTLHAIVRVYDGLDWSSWSPPRYFLIRTNRPPTGDFDWTPEPVYEGDTVTLRPTVNDSDRDGLAVTFRLTSPSGSVATRSSFYGYPYAAQSGPSVKMNESGDWIVRMTVDDGNAPPVNVQKTVRVLPLGLTARVLHTEAWEANRLRYNEKHPDGQRPSDWFWAGEAFVLEADATDTAGSATKATRVVADAGGGLRLELTNAEPARSVLWSGTLGSADAGFELADLEEGPYVFTFTVTYANGTTKTAAVPIRIRDTIDDYVQVHRIQ